jgi:hypothetical protein
VVCHCFKGRVFLHGLFDWASEVTPYAESTATTCSFPMACKSSVRARGDFGVFSPAYDDHVAAEEAEIERNNSRY